MIAVTRDLICRGYRRKLNVSRTFLPTSSRDNVGTPRTEEEDNLKGMEREVSNSKEEDKGKVKVVGTEGNNNNMSYLTTFGPMLCLGLRSSVDRKYNFRLWRPLGSTRWFRK